MTLPVSVKMCLLHACCTLATELGMSSVCLSLSDITQLSVEVLEGLEQIDLVCLDDLQQVTGKQEWQAAIFCFVSS